MTTTTEDPDSISVAASTVLVHDVNDRDGVDHYVVIGEVRASSWIVRRMTKNTVREQTGMHTSRILSIAYGSPTGEPERVAKVTLRFRGARSCDGCLVTLARFELHAEAKRLRYDIEASLYRVSIDALRAAAAALGVVA